MSAPYDCEMRCYCEHCECPNFLNYMHHDDWSEEKDWACERCVEEHYKVEREDA